MSWNTEAQQAVKDCEHTGNCPCRPEECEVCKGTGMVLLLSHRPYGLIRGADGPLIAVGRSNDPAPYVGFVVGSEEGEEMTCPECHGEGSLS